MEDYLAKDIARLHFLQSFGALFGAGIGFYVTTLKLRHFENVFFGLIASSGAILALAFGAPESLPGKPELVHRGSLIGRELLTEIDDFLERSVDRS